MVCFTEGTDAAVWDDYTNNTKLEFSEDCVSFTTRVSARYPVNIDIGTNWSLIQVQTNIYRN